MTHLDIEHPELNNLILPKEKIFTLIEGIQKGIEIKMKEEIRIIHPLLNEVLCLGEKTKTLIGGKFSGFFIGFRKKRDQEAGRCGKTYLLCAMKKPRCLMPLSSPLFKSSN